MLLLLLFFFYNFCSVGIESGIGQWQMRECEKYYTSIHSDSHQIRLPFADDCARVCHVWSEHQKMATLDWGGLEKVSVFRWDFIFFVAAACIYCIYMECVRIPRTKKETCIPRVQVIGGKTVRMRRFSSPSNLSAVFFFGRSHRECYIITISARPLARKTICLGGTWTRRCRRHRHTHTLRTYLLHQRQLSEDDQFAYKVWVHRNGSGPTIDYGHG